MKFPLPLVGGIITLTQQSSAPTTAARDRPITLDPADDQERAGVPGGAAFARALDYEAALSEIDWELEEALASPGASVG